jgi:hypothetical protein
MKKLLKRIEWVIDYYFFYFMYSPFKKYRYCRYMMNKWGDKFKDRCV